MHYMSTMSKPYMRKDTGQVLLVHDNDHEAIACVAIYASCW